MATTQPEIKVKQKINILIVASITIIAYLFTQIIHEALGHGGMALLVGAKIIQVTNTNLQYDPIGISPSAGSVIAAGGTLANLKLPSAKARGFLELHYRVETPRFFPAPPEVELPVLRPRRSGATLPTWSSAGHSR